MNMVGGQRHLVPRLQDIHRRVRPKQLNQQALVAGIEMLHQHKSHAGVGGHVVEEASEGCEPARRRADAYDQRGRPSPGHGS